jgi:hypothetical protein
MLPQLLQPQAESQATSQPLSQPFLHFLPNSFCSKPPLAGLQATTSQPQVGAGSQHAETSHPQAGSQAGAQPMSQLLSQPLLPWQPFPPNKRSNRPFFAGLQQETSQPQAGSQAGAQAVSQPQAGSQPVEQGASQPQAGSQTDPQGASHPQTGSQAGAQPVEQGASQPHAGSQLVAQGSSHPQAGSQVTPQGAASQTTVSQQVLSHPLPLRPSIRSSKSKPKLWEHMLVPRTMTPTRIVRFMEPRLLRYLLGRHI